MAYVKKHAGLGHINVTSSKEQTQPSQISNYILAIFDPRFFDMLTRLGSCAGVIIFVVSYVSYFEILIMPESSSLRSTTPIATKKGGGLHKDIQNLLSTVQNKGRRSLTPPFTTAAKTKAACIYTPHMLLQSHTRTLLYTFSVPVQPFHAQHFPYTNLCTVLLDSI